MSFLFGLQELHAQVVPGDSTTQAVADTLGIVDSLSKNVDQASRGLAAGDLGALATLYDTVVASFIAAVPSMISAFFVFIVLYASYRVIGFFLKGMVKRSRRVDIALENLLVKTYRITAISLILIMVISQFGVNVTALIAGLSVVGIAVGFAAQDTVSNFISGITILMDSPFKVGHFVEIENVKGNVIEITLRSTRVRTLNNQLMVLPNVQMVNQKLINHTMLGVIRIEVPFSIAYKEFPEQARQAVLDAVSDDPRLYPHFPPTVVVSALNDSSIDMILRVFLNDPAMEFDIRYELVEKVREVLRDVGIEIPFPHLQLHIDSATGLKK